MQLINLLLLDGLSTATRLAFLLQCRYITIICTLVDRATGDWRYPPGMLEKDSEAAKKGQQANGFIVFQDSICHRECFTRKRLSPDFIGN
jgi:hypothetical protein